MKKNEHFHIAMTAIAHYPQNDFSYHLIVELREQKCNFTANDFQMCLNHL